MKNINLCDDEKKVQINKYLDMNLDELKVEVEKEEQKIVDAEAFFESEVEKLQQAYEKLSSDKDQAIASVKGAGLGLMKSVIKSKEAPEAKDEL